MPILNRDSLEMLKNESTANTHEDETKLVLPPKNDKQIVLFLSYFFSITLKSVLS